MHSVILDVKKMNIGWDVDDDGYIIRIIFYVDDEKTANNIMNVMGGCLNNSTTLNNSL